MSVQTTDAGGTAGTWQVPAGGPEAGKERASGPVDGERSQPDRAGQPKGKPGPNTSEGEGPSNVGLAEVFQGGPGAGEERASGPGNGERSQPDRAGQPKGNPRPDQSNDNLTLPAWARQLPKKLTADSNSAEKLSEFKTLDEFVQAYLDATANAGEASLPFPGKDSTPGELHAFYEKLGKPREASGYPFAKDNPGFAEEAFKANLTASQAESLHASGQARLAEAREAARAAVSRDFQTTDALLRKEYGGRYEEAKALLRRGLGNNPSTGEPSPVAKALLDAGLAGRPEIARAFIELGRATSEGAAASGATGAARPQSVMEGRGFSWKDQYN